MTKPQIGWLGEDASKETAEIDEAFSQLLSFIHQPTRPPMALSKQPNRRRIFSFGRVIL